MFQPTKTNLIWGIVLFLYTLGIAVVYTYIVPLADFRYVFVLICTWLLVLVDSIILIAIIIKKMTTRRRDRY